MVALGTLEDCLVACYPEDEADACVNFEVAEDEGIDSQGIIWISISLLPLLTLVLSHFVEMLLSLLESCLVLDLVWEHFEVLESLLAVTILLI